MASATNEKAIRKAERQRIEDVANDKLVITALMSYPEGRRWVWLKLAAAQMFSADEGLDPYRMAFEKGRRNSGLALLASVTAHTPDMYIRMTNENTLAPAKLEEPSDERSTDTD